MIIRCFPYRIIMPDECPDCGAQVPSLFEHNIGCSRFDDRRPLRREIHAVHDLTFSQIREIIDPILGDAARHVLVVDGWWSSQPRDMFIGENGHKKRRPRNEEATELFRNTVKQRHKGALDESLPFVAGPAVLFERKVMR